MDRVRHFVTPRIKCGFLRAGVFLAWIFLGAYPGDFGARYFLEWGFLFPPYLFLFSPVIVCGKYALV